MRYIKKYSILILVIFIALINTIFLIKKPLYNETNVLDLINFINKNIENNQLIQIDLNIYNKIDLGAVIRILANQNIYHDNLFPFALRAFSKWKERKENIIKIENLFNKHNYRLAICSLKKLNIDYYIASIKFDKKIIKKYVLYENAKYILIKTNINC